MDERKVLTIEEVYNFVSSKSDKKASSEAINNQFRELGYSQGQIAGILKRGVDSRKLKKISRAMYSISIDNIYLTVVSKIEEVIEFTNLITLEEYNNLDDQEKSKLNQLIKKVKQLEVK